MTEKPDIYKDVNQEAEMPFVEHLEVLRWHLIRAFVAYLICVIVAFVFMKSFFYPVVIMGPTKPDFITYRFLCDLARQYHIPQLCLGDFKVTLQNIKVSGQFMTHLNSSFIIGLVLSFPYIFVELWNFVKPALQHSELKMGRFLIIWVSLLFMIGLSFAYFIILPYSFQFFATYQLDPGVENIFTLSNYISMASSLVIGTGLVFLIPLVIYFLSKMGIVDVDMLRKFRKYAVIAIFFLGAVITPPDVVSQILVSIPILFLYEISILVSSRHSRKHKSLYDE